MSLALAQQLAPDGEARFASAIRPHVRHLFGLAYSILRDPGDAEDAVQETLVQAWRAWDQLKDETKLRAWLNRICVRHATRRRLRLGNRFEAVDFSRGAWASDETAPSEMRFLHLEGGFRRLTTQQRAVVVLTYYHGYTVTEAAGAMGCRPGTARSHLGRALATLRKELGDD